MDSMPVRRWAEIGVDDGFISGGWLNKELPDMQDYYRGDLVRKLRDVAIYHADGPTSIDAILEAFSALEEE